MRHIALAVATLLLGLPAWAHDGSLYFEFDATIHTSCEMTIPCNCRGRMYVFGQLRGASAGGITAAAYKINVGNSRAADPGWLFAEAFPTGSIVVGSGALNPPDNQLRGVVIARPTCRSRTSPRCSTPTRTTGF